MNCPRCGNDIGLIAQLEEWMEMAEGALPPVMTALWCNHCEDSTMMWFLEETEGSMEVDSPALGEKVKIPLPKSRKENDG